MSEDANVGSIDAVREFRAFMATFLHESRDALVTFDMESRRALEWITKTQPEYWRREAKKCQERITEANIALQACRAQKLPGGGEPACLEEKKVLSRAKAQLIYIEDKQQKTKKWGAVSERQALEYKGRANQLQSLLDSEGPNALAFLERVLNSLEAYIGMNHPGMAAVYENAVPSSAAAGQPADEADAAAAGGQASDDQGAKTEAPAEGESAPEADATLAEPAADATAEQEKGDGADESVAAPNVRAHTRG